MNVLELTRLQLETEIDRAILVYVNAHFNRYGTTTDFIRVTKMAVREVLYAFPEGKLYTATIDQAGRLFIGV